MRCAGANAVAKFGMMNVARPYMACVEGEMCFHALQVALATERMVVAVGDERTIAA